MDLQRDLLPGDYVTFLQYRTNIISRKKHKQGSSSTNRYIQHTQAVFIKYTKRFRHAELRIQHKTYKNRPYTRLHKEKYSWIHIKPDKIWCVIRDGLFLYTSN